MNQALFLSSIPKLVKRAFEMALHHDHCDGSFHQRFLAKTIQNFLHTHRGSCSVNRSSSRVHSSKISGSNHSIIFHSLASMPTCSVSAFLKAIFLLMASVVMSGQVIEVGRVLPRINSIISAYRANRFPLK